MPVKIKKIILVCVLMLLPALIAPIAANAQSERLDGSLRNQAEEAQSNGEERLDGSLRNQAEEARRENALNPSAPLDNQEDNYSKDCNEGITPEKCGIVAYLVTFINILSAVVGVVIVIMIVWGGIQYTISKDNPQQTAAAKEHIKNAVIALVLYLFMVGFLQWLVPGGIF